MKNLQDAKILVTGGTGFIGGRLIERLVLEHGVRPRVLVRNFGRASRVARFGLEMVPGSTMDQATLRTAMRDCQFVFHCAHDASLGPEQAKGAEDSAEQICLAAHKSGIERLVHLSSISVYGNTPDSDLTEKSPWAKSKNDAYIAAKRASELKVRSWIDQRGFSATILQPTIVYGPWSVPWTIAVASDLLSGGVPLVDGGNGLCNAVYVDDVVDAMLAAALRPQAKGEAFLISGAAPVTWREFYGAYEEVLGVRGCRAVTSEELAAEAKAKRRRASTMGEISHLLSSPSTRRWVMGLPVTRGTVKVIKPRLPPRQWTALRGVVVGRAEEQGSDARASAPPPLLIIPDATRVALYRSRTHVRIDKARELLGYEPRYDLSRGIEMAGAFLRWRGTAA